MDVREAFSERMWFGTVLIFGYFVLVVIALLFAAADRLQLAKDALLVLGPIVGAVANAVFRTDKVDKAQAASIATLSESVAATARNQQP